MRVLYPWQSNACLPILDCLGVERATRQRRSLLQHVMHQFKLQTHRWRCSLQLGTCSGDTTASILAMANKCLFANLLLLLLTSGESDEATSLSFITRYVPIEAPSASLEALIATWYI